MNQCCNVRPCLSKIRRPKSKSSLFLMPALHCSLKEQEKRQISFLRWIWQPFPSSLSGTACGDISCDTIHPLSFLSYRIPSGKLPLPSLPSKKHGGLRQTPALFGLLHD